MVAVASVAGAGDEAAAPDARDAGRAARGRGQAAQPPVGAAVEDRSTRCSQATFGDDACGGRRQTHGRPRRRRAAGGAKPAGAQAAAPDAHQRRGAVRRAAVRRRCRTSIRFTSCRTPRRRSSTDRRRTCRGCRRCPTRSRSAMWSSWVEINPQTAERLRIAQGDVVEIASAHGSLRAPALISPGIAPDVIAMPVGQGHETFTRYASGRGENPVAHSRAGDRSRKPARSRGRRRACKIDASRRTRRSADPVRRGEMREQPHEYEKQ